MPTETNIVRQGAKQEAAQVGIGLPVRVGGVLFMLVFVVFGTWAALAPL
ncbi:MAG: hypothetical protein HOI34_10090, partial [Rhodospirillaceae bacterium]|nr:hypothetical protein [Rhodospirillaceae bacterium]